jgi:hypothetical protein
MFGLGAATRIYVAVGPTDMRKGFEGLFGLVKERLGLNPLSGHLTTTPQAIQDLAHQALLKTFDRAGEFIRS